MTRERAVAFAKRNLVDSIWKSANLEGINVTYPATAAILENISTQGRKPNEIMAIINLKGTWQFILDEDILECPPDLSLIMQVNGLLGAGGIVIDAGYIRQVPVSIGGTKWKPEIPDKDGVRAELQAILAIENVTERALSMFLYLARSQLFIDGNKRTATMVANQILVAGGKGILAIPVEEQPEFFELLLHHYETGEKAEIMEFLYEKCLDGLQSAPGDTI